MKLFTVIISKLIWYRFPLDIQIVENMEHYIKIPLWYLGTSKRLPLRPLTTLTRDNGMFASLQRDVLNSLAREARKNVCILEATWRFVDERVSAR